MTVKEAAIAAVLELPETCSGEDVLSRIESAVTTRQEGVVDRNRAARELLAAWATEDQSATNAELEQRRADWEAFKVSIDEHRTSDRRLFP